MKEGLDDTRDAVENPQKKNLTAEIAKSARLPKQSGGQAEKMIGIETETKVFFSLRPRRSLRLSFSTALLEYIGDVVARKLNVPPLAVTMFKKANEISGINKETLPTELIPLNTIQLARGLLNFTLLQSIRGWVFPYWAERQYNPRSTSFVPRSHLGLSVNLTHRNWTAVGSMECDVEPIVDPRGLVTPFRDGWSLDVWLKMNGKIFFPSKSATARQLLVNDCPIVETSFDIGTVTLILTTYVVETTLVCRASVKNNTGKSEQGTLFYALRPFNPEGIGLVHDLEFIEEGRALRVNSHQIRFSSRPTMVDCSSYERGDCANISIEEDSNRGQDKTHCAAGLANAVAGFDLNLAAFQTQEFEASCVLLRRSTYGQEPTARPDTSRESDASETWEDILRQGGTLQTPDDHVNSIFKSSLTTLLLLVDQDSITPGPFTYHQFWFRDAAYMLWALDKFGFSHITEPVMRSFAKRQTRSGYFRSQQGEWDSNGQVLWIAWQHLLHSNNRAFAQEQLPSLRNGAKWIEEKRLAGKTTEEKAFHGLMPRGLSAEHLGLADYYFWDNFWSLAGLESFAAICERLDLHDEAERAQKESDNYRADIERSIERVQQNCATTAITAGPLRKIDCGMIGSVAALYPLQALPPGDSRVVQTLQILTDQFCINGMFFQDFIHSGMNAYLTLQIAHAWLYCGEREQFWRMFSTVCSFASPTMNFPEAIHPTTGGGCMGDGHHGWPAAEIILALRDAFVYERKQSDGFELVLLGGIPASWFTAAKSFSIERTPVAGGIISVRARANGKTMDIEIEFVRANGVLPRQMILALPIVARQILSEEGQMFPHVVKAGQSFVESEVKSLRLRVIV